MAGPELELESWLLECVTRYPYFARGVAALRPVLHSEPAIAIDSSWRLYWSPQALFAIWSNGGRAPETVRHMLEHVLRGHGERLCSQDPDAWHQACECEINDDLDTGALPIDAIMCAPHGKSAEDYYQTVLAQPLRGWVCGGGSGAGAPRDWELPPDGHSIDPDTAERIRDAVAGDILAAANIGTELDEGTLAWATARRKPVTLPRDPMRGVRSTLQGLSRGRDDWSYAVPNRRQDESPLILPGRIRAERDVALVIDVSGSMEPHGAWVAGALHAAKQRYRNVQVFACSVAVTQRVRVRSWLDAQRLAVGGGTDMRVGVQAALDAGYPSVLLLTDGYTPWPRPWPNGLVALLPDGTAVRHA